MKKFFAVIFLLAFIVFGCKKQSSSINECNGCKLIGIYTGMFHDEAGCYACVPYLDTTYNGFFSVDTIGGDSLFIIRSYDSYSWRYSMNDSNYYTRHFNLNGMEDFEFISTDSIKYYLNNGGSGGYFRQTFSGKKL